MRSPIIVNDNTDKSRPGDVSVYSDIDTALRSFEVYDVGDNNISIYDTDGNSYNLGLSDDGLSVKIVQKNGSPERDLVKKIISVYLTNILSQDFLEKMELIDLATIFLIIDPSPYT
jgi:hypothetical protein